MLTKTAATAKVRALQQMLKAEGMDALESSRGRQLIQEIQQAISGANEREIMGLGSGMEHLSSLVVHPQLGLVVRKGPKGGVPINQYIREEVPFLKAWQRAHEETGFSPEIARVLGIDDVNGISFHEYVPGKEAREVFNLSDQDIILRMQESMAQRIPDKLRDMPLLGRLVNLPEPPAGTIPGGRGTFAQRTVGQQEFLNRLAKDYPDVADFAEHNIRVRPTGEQVLIDLLDNPMPLAGSKRGILAGEKFIRPFGNGVIERLGTGQAMPLLAQPVLDQMVTKNPGIRSIMETLYDDAIRGIEESGRFNPHLPFQVRKGQRPLPDRTSVDAVNRVGNKVVGALGAGKDMAMQGLSKFKKLVGLSAED